ncbi:MAG: hypothetical protein E7458_06950 [Ruminococcaceae bacterium]|nr:hypothetical protein [Oscillospiraceae bacterium]
MANFWDFNVWGFMNLLAVIFLGLLAANALKRKIRILQASLIPTSVLAGLLLLAVSSVYRYITGDVFFDTPFFGGNGMMTLEVLTYHTLALGFIASTLKAGSGKLSKKRSIEIFNTGVTTVSTYLLQAVVGMGITLIAAWILKDFFSAAGVLLPFGFGQGTGQAMNYGTIYETEHGFAGGKNFGLTIAALGFLSAAFGGVFYLNLLKRRGRIQVIGGEKSEGSLRFSEIQQENEIPMQGSMDKLTVQIALIAVAYFVSYLLMLALGMILPGMRSVIYGFNFLLGVLAATLVKVVLNLLKKSGLGTRVYTNDFLMTRASNFFFDLMVVAGIAVIRLDILESYWGVILLLGVAGLLFTYLYNRFVAKKLFPDYQEEQFLMMYGMLTGTASTGVILLRELDGDFKTPAADNLVYQNFPAIVFGFPMMLLATLAPVKPLLTYGILVAFFIVMNVILFRSYLFKKKNR